MFRRLLLSLFIITQVQAQTFADFVRRVNILPQSQRQAVVDSFLAAVTVFPYVENDTTVHFLYNGSANYMQLAGDANGWDPSKTFLNKLSTTSLWYLSKKYESDARLDYKFVVNGNSWLLDPKNPNQCYGGFGPNSELRMPAYVPPPEVVYNASVPHGVIRDSLVFSAALNNSRTIRIYTPPGYEASSRRYPMVLVHDGPEYISLAQMNNVMDNLIAAGRIEPVVAFFVPPSSAGERTAEYAGEKEAAFSDFICKQLVPYWLEHYRIEPAADRHLVMGASNGGNISLYLGMNRPDIWGLVAAQSSYIQPTLVSAFTNGDRAPIKIYLDLGTYDIALLIPLVRGIVPVLDQKGYSYFYQELHEGHSWGNWKARLDDILEHFFSATGQGIEGRIGLPEMFELGQNYPNPFNPSTTIPFNLRQKGRVRLQVFDALGREVAEVMDGSLNAGEYAILFNASSLASGCYFYRLSLADQMRQRRMVLMR